MALAIFATVLANGQQSRIDGTIVIDVKYTDTEITSERVKDDMTETKTYLSTTITGNFHSSQPIHITKDNEGESFLIYEQPQPTLGGSLNYSLSSRRSFHSDTDGKDFPPMTTTAKASASGKPSAEHCRGANIDHAGDNGDLSVGITAGFGIEASNSLTKVRSHHWVGEPFKGKLVEEVTSDTTSTTLPSVGNSESFNFTLRPSPPPGETGEKPDPGADFDANIFYGAKTRKLPKGGYIVTCSATINSPPLPPEPSMPNVRKTTVHSHIKTVTAKVTIIPGTKPPGELVIEPDDNVAYDQWTPVPVCDSAEIQLLYPDPNPVLMKATIKPKGSNKFAPASPLDFYLTEVSKHNGRCGNEPKDDNSLGPKPGLRFCKNQGPGIVVDPENPQHASIKEEVTGGTIAIEAIEAGAYGRLEVTADSIDLTGVDLRTGDKFTRLPMDDNQNHVADGWERSKGIYSKRYPAVWDEDNVPDTGKDNKGDGLTLYEEYRGFVALSQVKQQPDRALWQRLQPAVKKLFVYPQGDDKDLFIAGGRLYESVTGTKVYFIFDDKSVAMDDLGTAKRQRWINFNSTTNDDIDFKGRQFAVNVIDDPAAHISTWSAPNEDEVDVASRTPEQVEAVHIGRPYVEHEVMDYFIGILPPAVVVPPYPPPPNTPPPANAIDIRWQEADAKLKAAHIDVQLASIGTRMKAAEKTLVDNYVTFAVMHELGHATGAKHHQLDASLKDSADHEDRYYSSGDYHCPMYYWNTDERQVVDNFALRLRFFDGQWAPTVNSPSETPWVFCTDCAPLMHLIKK